MLFALSLLLNNRYDLLLPLFMFSFFFFFFSSRRRHTRYIGDWSSDVCSSDLGCVRCRDSKCRLRRWRQQLSTKFPSAMNGNTSRSGTAFAASRFVAARRLSRSEERRVGKECR